MTATLSTFVTLALLLQYGSAEGFNDELSVIGATVGAVLVLSPVVRFLGHLWRAPLTIRDDAIKQLESDHEKDVGQLDVAKERIRQLQSIRDKQGRRPGRDQAGPAAPPPIDLLDECGRLEEALRWLVNLHHGVGKAGGPPEAGEWEAAIIQAKAMLD